MNHICPISGSGPGRRLDIAVVGSGIAGMSAAWLLSQGHNVTVYEKEGRVGGHSNTVDFPGINGPQPVDTGFIVYNEVNYPNLVALFGHLGVPTKPSNMSFSVSIDGGRLEYGSAGANAVVGQRRNIVKPRFWRMMTEIRRFYTEAKDYLNADISHLHQTLGEFLDIRGYGRDFSDLFILPIGAAIWSTKPAEMRVQPALTFLRFFASHGLLAFDGGIKWRTVDGGSREYVNRLTADYAEQVKVGAGVRSISRFPGGIEVMDAAGNLNRHDHVVIAAHGDEAFAMLRDADSLESVILGQFRYTDNQVVLHTDERLMPRRRRIWSSWNYNGTAEDGVSVTYWMNSLQGIDPRSPLFISVNPKIELDHRKVLQTFRYQHPFFDIGAWSAQRRLWELQGRRNTWFCGSYFGYGFHEDGLQSGLAVAEDLGGIRRPWSVANESGRIYRLPGVLQKAA